MLKAIGSFKKDIQSKKKTRGVIVYKNSISELLNDSNHKHRNDLKSLDQDNFSSFVTPLSSTRAGVTPRVFEANKDNSITSKKVWLTSQRQCPKTKRNIKYFNIKLKGNNTPCEYSSSKGNTNYITNCNKTTSYSAKCHKCSHSNKKSKLIKTKPKQDSIDHSSDYPHDLYTSRFVKESFKPVNTHLENIIRNNKNEIKHFIDIEATKTQTTLCNKESFDEKVRYPMLYCNLREKEKKAFVPSKKRFSLNNITNKFNLQNEVRKRVKQIHKGESIKQNKEKLQKWRRIIIHAAIESQQYHLTIDDIKKIHARSFVAYEHSKSYELFQAVKDGDKNNYIRLVNENSCLVLDFDHALQTVLHWLAKRNRYDWISFTAQHGASLNSLDCTGKTPLHIASLMNNVESVQVLLYEMANPFCKDNDGYTPNQLTSHPRILFIFHRVILLYAIHSMGKSKKFEENVRRGLRFLYINELQTNFSLSEYCIIDKKKVI